MEARPVSYPQTTAPVVQAPQADPADAVPPYRSMQGMLLQFIGLLQELRKTFDEMHCRIKCNSLSLLETYKHKQGEMRDEKRGAQKLQATVHFVTGIVGLGTGVVGGVLGRKGNGFASGIDTASHLSSPAGSGANSIADWFASDKNYKSEEAQLASELAKEGMNASDSHASREGDERARIQEDYLSQWRAGIQELVAAIKATVR